MTINGQYELLPITAKPASVDPLLAKLAELRRLSPTAARVLEELVDAAIVRMRLQERRA